MFERLVNLLLPTLQHFSTLGYWIVLAVALLESLVLVGIFIPGTVIVILAGFLAAKGYLDVGDLIWFAAIGAILGDGISFYLGKKGTRLFHPNSKLFKLSYLEKGVQFLKRHGTKSVFFGRFMGPIRPISPFVAGMFKMDTKRFYFWNVLSAFAWAALYVLLGYFFGQAWQAIATWSTRIGIFVVSLFFFLLAISAVRWFVIRKGKYLFSLAASVYRSIIQAIVSNPDIQKLAAKHPIILGFLKNRLTRQRFSGLPLTLLLAAFIYTFILFFGLIEDFLTSDLIVAIDTRLANLLYVFRSPELVTIFLWITLLGKSLIVIVFALMATIVLWLWRKREYLLPLWLAIIGSQIITFIGKLSLHRTRPDGLVPVYVENSYSFPSGHATIATAFYGFLIYILWRNTKSWTYKINILFAGLVLIAAIGLSRLYLGVHFLSDVLSGYLLGLLWLIISVSIVEWQKSRKSIKPAPATVSARMMGYACLVVAFIVYGGYARSYHPQLNLGTTDPAVSQLLVEKNNILAAFEQNRLPKFTETLSGNPQEPLSFIILANDDAQLVNAFEKSSWYLADPVTVSSVASITKAAVSKTSYDTAPMTPSFWHSRVHNFGFEKPTVDNIVNQRHHARFWKTNLQTNSGERVYAGTASFDSGIKWLVTHKINPDIDTERELLFADLQNAGLVATSSKETFVAPVLGENFTGDQFFTDGKVYLVVLKNK